MPISFFKTQGQSVIATQANHQLTAEEVEKLCWLYGEATPLNAENLDVS